ncbi:MAG: alpha-glucosidase [Acholeplasma sp.]|nr:alpha-glucosidase [Acholeplasma sp.]
MKKWWMEAVGYQIYPKSFYDTNGDGIGDLNGITNKLEYLKKLGITLIWIGPFYDSPMDDNGYDVRDFFSVAKEFGTLDDFKKLVAKAKKLDIKIILDFVLNHTSDEHQWFIESKSSINNPKRDYYIWQKGKNVDGKKMPPTNWASFFGGSAWKYDQTTDMYYMKIFSDKMPDLNWANKKVREEMASVGKWWLNLGIDGFRIDAVSHLDRAPFEDSLLDTKTVLDWNKFSNLPRVHNYLKEMNNDLFKKYDALTIGEVGGAASIDSAIEYSAFESNELSMVFNFDHNWCNNLHDIDNYNDLKTNVKALKTVFTKWQTAFEKIGWIPLNWLNHDQPRLMSQYGDSDYFKESGKMLASVRYLMRGTPFIFQGEEIGMTNYPFKEYNEFRDVSSKNYYHSIEGINEEERIFQVRKTSRDHPRTPMQWNTSKYAGFSTKEPWINVNPNYLEINVEKCLNDYDSIWYHYQRIIDLRSNPLYKDVIVYGTFEELDSRDNVYAYKRENANKCMIVVSSFTKEKEEYNLKNYEIKEVILSNYQDIKIQNNIIELRPYESVLVEVMKNE